MNDNSYVNYNLFLFSSSLYRLYALKSFCKAKTNLESTCVTLSISHNNILLNLKLQTTQLEAFEIDIKLLFKIYI